MHTGAVIVDVSIDQGGCVEAMHPTTHENPTFIVDGIVHYGVANMPGGVPSPPGADQRNIALCAAIG